MFPLIKLAKKLKEASVNAEAGRLALVKVSIN